MEYHSFDELPLTLSLPETAKVLGISRTSAYALAAGACPGTSPLPTLRIGGRRVVPKEALVRWIRENTAPLGAPSPAEGAQPGTNGGMDG